MRSPRLCLNEDGECVGLFVFLEEVLRRIEPIHRGQRNFDEISRQDIASWESKGMVESRLFALRNEVIEERFLSGEERK